MIRVLHVLPDLGPGGAERVAMHLLLNANRDRFDVGLVSLFDRAGTEIEMRLDDAGVRTWYLGKRLGADLRMIWRLRNIFSDYQPDLIHTHRYVLRYVLPARVGLSRVPIVHTIHSIAEKEVDTLGRVLHGVAFHHGAVIPVSIAPKVSESLSRLYGIKHYELIPNGIPTKEYAAVSPSCRGVIRRKCSVMPEELIVLAIGRLTTEKNHRMLIDALSRIRQRSNLRLRCFIVGTGKLESDLKSFAAERGISEDVAFLGTRSDIPALLSAADIYAMPSEWEGNPLSLMEAMAAGLPVVGTNVGGIPDLVVNGECGLLVERGDAGGFAAAVELLARDSRLRERLAACAARKAAKKFGVEQMTCAYERLYMRAAEDPTSRFA